MVRRKSKWLTAAMIVGVVLLIPSFTSPHPGVSLREDSAVHTATGACPITITLSQAFAFAVSNDYCTTSHVAVEVIETSSVPHTFTLSAAANYSFSANNQTSDLESFFSLHPPLVNVVPSPNPGATNFTNFTTPTTVGFFEFVCMEQGHFQENMYGFIGINVTPPGGGGVAGPGAAVFIIAGTIAGLVVIAIVLGFVVGRRRGPEEEMPPERLGYPEPEPPLASPDKSTALSDPGTGAKR